VFATVSHLYPNLVVAGKNGADYGTQLKWLALSLTPSSGWKRLILANTLAYYDTAKITVVKGFIVHGPWSIQCMVDLAVTLSICRQTFKWHYFYYGQLDGGMVDLYLFIVLHKCLLAKWFLAKICQTKVSFILIHWQEFSLWTGFIKKSERKEREKERESK
jgi:hypothetical protein